MAEKWTKERVEERLEEAAEIMKRLPAVKPQQIRSAWPPIIQEFWEAYGWNETHVRLGPPPPDAITRMDECMEWLRWLERDQMQLVWARAERIPWKVILNRLGVSRATAWRNWSLALSELAIRLNSR